MNHVVFVSGGKQSFELCKRVLAKYTTEPVYMLFADTKTEDDDLYRFLYDMEKFFKCFIIRLADGRNIWELFIDNKFMGNSRVDICSRVLKRDLCYRWLKTSFSDKDQVLIHLGFDWEENHRIERAKKAWKDKGYSTEFLLAEEPFFWDADYYKSIESSGITLPRLYKMGLAHNNCGGGCVKGGKKSFALLYEKFPDRYREWEENELIVYEKIKTTRPFLKSMANGVQSYLTLKEFREKELEPLKNTTDLYKKVSGDFGICSCFSADD